MKKSQLGQSLAGFLILLATQCALPKLTNDDPVEAGDGGSSGDGDGDGPSGGDGDDLVGSAGDGPGGTGNVYSGPECEAGDVGCHDEFTRHTCSAEGEWSLLERCTADKPVCNELTGACAECGPDGEKRCSNAVTLQKCSAEGQWEDDEICTGGLVCLAAAAACGSCQAGTHQCNGNESLTCLESGSWGPGTACEGTTPVCAEGTGQCEECDPDLGTGKSCDGNTPRTCIDYEWVPDTEDCGAGSPELPLCDNATGACVCEEGAFRCATSSGRQQCTLGQWQTATSCVDDTSHCLEYDGSCVSCLRDNDCVPENDCMTASCASGTTHACEETPKTPAGSHRCDYTSIDDGYCDGEGACVECSENTHCPPTSGNPSETLCRDNSCVDPLHYVGWSYPDSPAITTNTTVSPDAIYWFRLPALTYNATLTKFGAHGSGGGVSLKMALYADGGTEPGNVLAETSLPLALFNGYPEIAAQGSTTLTAGERYFIAVKVSSQTTAIRRSVQSGASGWVDDATYGDTSWPTFSSESASDINDEDWGIYIQVEDTE